jgi:hypothetical protein
LAWSSLPALIGVLVSLFCIRGRPVRAGFIRIPAAIRRFSAISNAAIPRLPPLPGKAAQGLAPVRGRERFILPAAIPGALTAVRALPAVLVVPAAVYPGPAVAGAAAAVIPAYAGLAAANIQTALRIFRYAGIFVFLTHANSSCPRAKLL